MGKKSLLLVLAGQLGAMVAAITTCILCGLYIQDEQKMENPDNQCLFQGYGHKGLAIATIALNGVAVLMLVCAMLVTLVKQEDSIELQVALTLIPTILICIGSVLIGALLGLSITTNKNGDSRPWDET
jgi:hypothetical protein